MAKQTESIAEKIIDISPSKELSLTRRVRFKGVYIDQIEKTITIYGFLSAYDATNKELKEDVVPKECFWKVDNTRRVDDDAALLPIESEEGTPYFDFIHENLISTSTFGYEAIEHIISQEELIQQ